MPKSERDGNVIGFWRWCDEFFGHLRPDGTLIQHRDANLQMRFGTWTATPDGFEMELTGHWRKHVKLDGLDTGTWRLHGSPEHFGSISKLGRSPHCPPAMDRPTFPCCDGYRFFANESTIVLHTDSVLEWHRKCRPDSDYVLVTTHSDTPVDGRFRDILNDERLVKWYATNVQTPHPKLAPVPLGVSHRLALASHMDPPMCRNDFERLLGKASSLPKTKQFNVSFLTRTNPSARQRCLKATGLRNSALSREAYIEDLGSSRFCISPEGCGIDCHRTWESLCCRTIPVITWNPMVNMGLYDGLPVIVLDSWEDFHAEDFTDERYERVMGDFAPSSLRLERWLSVHAQ